VYYGQEARPYGFVVLFALVAVLCLLRALERPTLLRWLAYGAAVAALVYSHDFALLSVLAHPVLAVGASRSAKRRFALTLGLPALLIAPILVAVPPGFGVAAFSWIPAPDLGVVASTAVEFAGSPAGFVACAVVLVAGLAISVQRVRRQRPLPFERHVPVFLGIWLLGPFVVLLAVSLFQPVLVPRYVLQSLPALCLALALAVAVMQRRVALLATALVAALFLTASVQESRDRTKPDWPGAASYLAEAAAPEDRIVVLGRTGASIDGLVYYEPSFGVDRRRLPSASGEWPDRFVLVRGSDSQPLIDAAREERRLWLVRHGEWTSLQDALRGVLASCEVEALSFRQIEILRLDNCSA
jgi:mannosyltransferase